MRLRDIFETDRDGKQLDEMPLAAYHLRHDKNRDFDPKRKNSKAWSKNNKPKDIESFFRKSDRVLVSNNKTIEKLERILGKFDIDYHFMFVNTTVVDVSWEDFYGAIKTKYIDIGSYQGNLGDGDEHLLAVKKIHDDDPDACIVIFRSNDPNGYSGHMPLTPWMMLHRWQHSLKLGNGLRNPLETLQSLIEHIHEHLKYYGDYLAPINDMIINNTWTKNFLPFRTARLGKWEDFTELTHDIAVHMMINLKYELPSYEQTFPELYALEQAVDDKSIFEKMRYTYEEFRVEYYTSRDRLLKTMNVTLKGRAYIV